MQLILGLMLTSLFGEFFYLAEVAMIRLWFKFHKISSAGSLIKTNNEREPSPPNPTIGGR